MIQDLNPLRLPGGYHLVQNPHLNEFTEEPIRKHKWKPWMRGRVYHHRVQKKWAKRFGAQSKRQVITANDMIIAHPNTIKLIQQSYGIL